MKLVSTKHWPPLTAIAPVSHKSYVFRDFSPTSLRMHVFSQRILSQGSPDCFPSNPSVSDIPHIHPYAPISPLILRLRSEIRLPSPPSGTPPIFPKNLAVFFPRQISNFTMHGLLFLASQPHGHFLGVWRRCPMPHIPADPRLQGQFPCICIGSPKAWKASSYAFAHGLLKAWRASSYAFLHGLLRLGMPVPVHFDMVS